ncbi:MAG: hypothetical protein ACI9A7_000979 [Cyclobacteriaceae bacterium]
MYIALSSVICLASAVLPICRWPIMPTTGNCKSNIGKFYNGLTLNHSRIFK